MNKIKKYHKIKETNFLIYGSCGGSYTYSFIPISIGIIINFKNTVTGEKIDLTNYDEF